MARGEGAQETPIVRIAAEPGQRLDAGELSAHAMPPTIARRDVDDLAPQTHDAGHAPVTVRRLDIGPDAASAARALRTRRVLARGQGPSGARADRPRQAASDMQRPVPSRGAERVDARQTLVICAAPNLPCAVRDKRVVSRARLNQHLMPDLDCRSYAEIVARRPANLTRSRRFEMDTPRNAGDMLLSPDRFKGHAGACQFSCDGASVSQPGVARSSAEWSDACETTTTATSPGIWRM